MMLMLVLTSKGMAGVPRASLVVIAATLTQFNIPEAGLLLLGIDHFLDMARRRQVAGRTGGAGTERLDGGRTAVRRRPAPAQEAFQQWKAFFFISLTFDLDQVRAWKFVM
jgi:hypothetical protein